MNSKITTLVYALVITGAFGLISRQVFGSFEAIATESMTASQDHEANIRQLNAEKAELDIALSKAIFEEAKAKQALAARVTSGNVIRTATKEIQAKIVDEQRAVLKTLAPVQSGAETTEAFQ